MKKTTISLLLLPLIVGTVSGCKGIFGGGDEEDSTITKISIMNFGGGVGSQWLYNAIEEFEEINKDRSFEDGRVGVKIALAKKDIDLLNNYVGKEVVLGIRPEHIYTAEDKSIDNKSAEFEVKCEISELLGSEIIVYGELANQKVLMKISSKNNVQREDTVKCVFDEDAVHFFDAETKEAIK